MGSIVKTIGKVIKKAGKALKKIAPVLLVAAAAYVGYGYMTGFQSGGWPQITEWGKSLMGNVSSGMPISEAAMSADPSILADAAPQAQTFPLSGPGSVAGTPLDVTTTPPLPGTETGLLGTQASSIPTDIDTAANLPIDGLPEMASDPAGMISAMGDTGATVAEAGGLISGPRINPLFDSMDAEYKSTGLVDSFSDFLVGRANASEIGVNGAGVYDPAFSIEEFDYPVTTTYEDVWSNQPALSDSVEFQPGHNYGVYGANAASPYYSQGGGQLSGNPADAPSNYLPSYLDTGGSGIDDASPTIMSWGGKAWDFFKAAIKKDPGMAMWTGVEIVKFIATLLDKSAEQESYAARHVMGFDPGNYADLSKKYGGMPTSTKSDLWNKHDSGNRLTASSKVKTGTKPMGNTRISAINSSPGGIIGPTKQVQV